jgi:hypothetical protein
MVSRQAAGDPVAKGMTEDVRRAALESLKDSGNVRGKIMKGRVVERPAAGAHPSHVDGNDL